MLYLLDGFLIRDFSTNNATTECSTETTTDANSRKVNKYFNLMTIIIVVVVVVVVIIIIIIIIIITTTIIIIIIKPAQNLEPIA